MLMPGRTLSTEDYRFGFNDKENLNDVKGVGKLQDYGMRIFDPRLGRFLTVDSLANEYPMYSTYQFSGNSPIIMIDKDGLEPSLSQMTDNYLSKHWWGAPLKIANNASYRIANVVTVLGSGLGIAMVNFGSQIGNGNFEDFRNADNVFKPAVYQLNPVTFNIEEMDGASGEFLPFNSTGKEVLQMTVDVPLGALPVEKVSEFAGKQVVKYVADKLINAKAEDKKETQTSSTPNSNKTTSQTPQKKTADISKKQSSLYKIPASKNNRCEKVDSFK